MGHRANLILVQQGRHQVFNTHWGARTLPEDLFWGPECAERHFRLQEAADYWHDSISAEGGCVMDFDRRVLLLFGGEDVYYDVPLRRVWLELSRRLWEGWDVRWAHRGVADLAAHVGYPLDKVIATFERERQSPLPLRPLREGHCCCVASVRRLRGGMHFYPLIEDVMSYLRVGHDLLSPRDSVAGMERLDLADWTGSFPSGGFHIDVPMKQVRFWRNTAVADGGRSIEERWQGWDVRWDHDAFEVQMDLAGADLLWPVSRRQDLEDRVVTLMTTPPPPSMVDLVARLMQRADAVGKTIEVNRSAQREARFMPDAEARRQVLSRLLGRDV